ncbi:MAG: hypothetical protein VW547_08140, partial [Alphaproteobacteria bacterium]
TIIGDKGEFYVDAEAEGAPEDEEEPEALDPRGDDAAASDIDVDDSVGGAAGESPESDEDEAVGEVAENETEDEFAGEEFLGEEIADAEPAKEAEPAREPAEQH